MCLHSSTHSLVCIILDCLYIQYILPDAEPMEYGGVVNLLAWSSSLTFSDDQAALVRRHGVGDLLQVARRPGAATAVTTTAAAHQAAEAIALLETEKRKVMKRRVRR